MHPRDPGRCSGNAPVDEVVRRQPEMVGALVGTVLGRDLSPIEDAVIGWTIAELHSDDGREPTLADVVALMADPNPRMCELARTDAVELRRSVEAAIYAIGRKEVERLGRSGVDVAEYEGVQVVCTPDSSAILTVYRNSDFRGLKPRGGRRWH